MNIIALSIPAFLTGILLELFLSRRAGKTLYRLGDAMGCLGCGVGNQLVSVLFAGAVSMLVYTAVYQVRLVTLPEGWVPWVVAVLGYEFLYYWWHRLSHEVNILWAAHVVHHQSEDMNLAVALRQSVTTWATSLLFYWPLALLGVPPFHYAVVGSLNLLYQFWIHTELIPALGPVEYVLNTPALHRVHHAINPRYLDKNHGGTFAFFDVLFGTFERESEPCVYGTTRPINSFNPVWAQFETYAELWTLVRTAPTAWDGVRVLFASPAWHPPWAPQGPHRDLSRPVKYDPPVPSSAIFRYALVQWALVLAGATAIIMYGKTMPGWALAGSSLLMLLSLLSLPALVEGKAWARPLEGVRLAALAASALAVALVPYG